MVFLGQELSQKETDKIIAGYEKKCNELPDYMVNFLDSLNMGYAFTAILDKKNAGSVFLEDVSESTQKKLSELMKVSIECETEQDFFVFRFIQSYQLTEDPGDKGYLVTFSPEYVEVLEERAKRLQEFAKGSL